MRPAFLTGPGAWVRTPRTDTDPVRDAYAGEGPFRPQMRARDWAVLAAGVVIAVAAMLLAHWGT